MKMFHERYLSPKICKTHPFLSLQEEEEEKKHTRRVSSLFCRLHCPKKKKKFKLSLSSLSRTLKKILTHASFSPFLCLYEKSLFFGVWRHTQSCWCWWCLCSKNQRSHTLTLSNSNDVNSLSLKKKNKRAQQNEEEEEQRRTDESR